ncbi:MAG: hypothetical protein JWQ95_36 [Sphaerisporangium sp.]|nr:hypothetical protein [Sphaerisporangium sp.]
MSSGRNTVTVYFVAMGGVLLFGLVLFAPWPLWTSLVLAVALVTAAVLLVRAAGRRRSSRPSPEPSTRYVPPPPPPVERREQRVVQVPLPSEEEDYDFLFSATVLWSPVRFTVDEAVVNPAALAVDAVLKRAREITEHRGPGRASLVQHELGGVLGTMRADDTGCLQAMAELVEVTLSGDDQERLDKLAAVRKNKAIWEHERKYEQSKREYLGEDVLKDTGSAVVWWLTRNDDHVEKTVNDIGLLARLSSAANNKELPESFQRFAPGTESGYASEAPYLPFEDFPASPSRNGASAVDCFAAFLRTMDFAEGDSQSALLTRQMAALVGKHGRTEVAEEMLRRFDAPAPPPFPPFDPPADPPADGADDDPEQTGKS